MPKKKTAKFDFEASLEELESIVNNIEKGGLSLEGSLKLFEKGVVLTKDCQKAIKSAEQKVKILTGEKLSDFTLDLDEGEEEEDDGEDCDDEE